MQTSARNQLAGTIAEIVDGAVNTEIGIDIGAGRTFVAQITRSSAERLALAKGAKVVALIKSSWVMLGVGAEEPRVSARNRLRGDVSAILEGAVNSEVAVRLAGGGAIVATVTKESVASLDLQVGSAVWAIVKATSAIIALPD